eukprot:14441527-Heterocapsa_arctica.AAC.1
MLPHLQQHVALFATTFCLICNNSLTQTANAQGTNNKQTLLVCPLALSLSLSISLALSAATPRVWRAAAPRYY